MYLENTNTNLINEIAATRFVGLVNTNYFIDVRLNDDDFLVVETHVLVTIQWCSAVNKRQCNRIYKTITENAKLLYLQEFFFYFIR